MAVGTSELQRYCSKGRRRGERVRLQPWHKDPRTSPCREHSVLDILTNSRPAIRTLSDSPSTVQRAPHRAGPQEVSQFLYQAAAPHSPDANVFLAEVLSFPEKKN